MVYVSDRLTCTVYLKSFVDSKRPIISSIRAAEALKSNWYPALFEVFHFQPPVQTPITALWLGRSSGGGLFERSPHMHRAFAVIF